MRILFDHQIWEKQRYGGVSRYFFELIKEIKTNPGYECALSLKHANNEYLKTDPSASSSVKMFANSKSFWSIIRNLLHNNKPTQWAYNKLKEYVNKSASIQSLKNQDFDIFHPTYYDTYFLPYLDTKPFVLTIHDMIHEKYPTFFSNPQITSTRKKLLAEKATKIIAISENTKKDIIDLLNINPEKIEVIHHGTNIGKIKPTPISLPSSFFLFVGGRQGYKNFSTVLEAITPILRKKDIFLLCTGSPFTEKESETFREIGVSDKIIFQKCNDSELSFIYRNAVAFIFASIYEGFGIPIIEAMACECPLILSNASCFPEIAGEAADYFEPEDHEGLSVILNNIVKNGSHRNNLIKFGQKQITNYSWSKTAEKTMKVYKSCL